MPSLPTRRQQPSPVSPQVPIPNEFPAIPKEVLDRFPSAKDWQARLNEFWGRTAQALQEAQRQTAAQVNSQVIWTVDRFLVYTNNGGSMPMFALDDTGIRLGNVLVINTPGRKVYIGAGNYANDDTPFYIDTLGQFSLGASLTWNPNTDTLTITGIINATSGTIGGFDIGADYIRDTGNTFGLASTVTVSPDVRIWAGDTFANRDSAPFRVYETGDVQATSVNIASTLVVGGTISPIGACTDLRQMTSSTTDYDPNTMVSVFVDERSYAQDVGGGIGFVGKYNNAGSRAGFSSIWGGKENGTDGNYASYLGFGVRANGALVLEKMRLSSAGVLSTTGGIDNTAIGVATPAAGAFTTLDASGTVTLDSLAGVGTRNVVADANGVLSAP